MKCVRMIACVVTIFATGCSNSTPRQSYASDLQVVQAAQPDRNPLLIIVFKDETPSRYENGVPELTVSDFEPMLTLLDRNGGDLAIGWIRDRSNRPLEHCHFEEPPIPSSQAPEKKG